MKKNFCTNKAVVPRKSVSQAVIANNMIFVSGQISVDIRTKEIEKGDIELQTKNALHSLKIILEESGSGIKHVVMCNVYLSSMDYFERMDKVYGEFFGEEPPARVTIAVKEIYDNLDIEISAIATINE